MLRQKANIPEISSQAIGDDSRIVCGFGKLGRCCTACLKGPCRLHPIATERIPAYCDLLAVDMVAAHLHRTLAFEALARLSRLQVFIHKLQIENSVPPGNTKITDRSVANITIDDASQILYPANGMLPIQRLVSSLFPENLYPVVHRKELKVEHGLIPDLMHIAAPKGSEVSLETLLWECLKLVFIGLISGFLQQNLISVNFKQRECETGPLNPKSPMFQQSGSKKSGVIIIDRFGERLKPDTIRQFLEQEELSEHICQNDSWPLPLERIVREALNLQSKSPLLAVVLSDSAVDVLLPLLLGCDVVSYPLLPLGGSSQVADFFQTTLKRRFGVSYRLSNISEFKALMHKRQREIR